MSDDLGTLSGTLDAVWRHLEAAPDDPESPARHVGLATAGLDGGAELRLVVLRAADRGAGTLRIYTNRSSGKVAELRRDPRATLHFWDPAARLQARISADVAIGDGPRALWDALRPADRALYAGDPAPGLPLASPAHLAAAPPAAVPGQFVVLTALITRVETLHLDRKLHRRARFLRRDGWSGQWLVP